MSAVAPRPVASDGRDERQAETLQARGRAEEEGMASLSSRTRVDASERRGLSVREFRLPSLRCEVAPPFRRRPPNAEARRPKWRNTLAASIGDPSHREESPRAQD